MALADEYGADYAIERMVSTPERLGLERETRLREGLARDRLADALTAAIEANVELGWLVGGRETILCERDPNRERIYNVDGREAVLDVVGQKVRYLDDPDREDTLTIEAVEPREEPTPELVQKLTR